MKKQTYELNEVLKRSRFPMSLFGMYFAVLLLMSGIHVGLIVLMNKMNMNTFLQCTLPLIYWALVAAGITFLTRKKVRETYEEPLSNLAEATNKVSHGDFSVYMPTIHTSDRWDYLDLMILDFNKMVEELGSIETLKTDFVSNVSHEMKTPISIMKNYAELLQKDNITEEQRKEYSEYIEHAAMKLSNLISNILKLNKLENQKITPLAELYDVSRQLCDCILQFEEVWEEKAIEMDIELEDSAFAYADENLMELVWNNLLSNALKFTEPGGRIFVKQTSEEKKVIVTIEDTGCGMSEENVKHIFDKFYQGDSSHSRDGNGLGLAMVKRVIELVDGTIIVDSKEGKGSIFTVVLPSIEHNTGGNA